MPLYEYQCTECEATLEAIQAFSAPPLEECPTCGQPSLKKLLSAPAFQFKGSGWYVNDYARQGKNASTETAANSSAANGDGSESKGGTAAGESSSAEASSEGAGKGGGSAPSAKSESSSSAAT